MLLSGLVGVVSGAGPGLGRAIALSFAREGADVVLVARSVATLPALAREVEALGRRALGVQADITEPSACQRALAETLEVFGRVDVLVNNAFATGPMEPFAETSVMKSWRPAFKVNVFGTVQLTQAFAAHMKVQRRGSIVMVNSMAARKPARDLAAYGASKAALLHAAQGLAGELGPHGIRVNSVVPGHIDGPGLAFYLQMEAARLSITAEEVRQRIAAQGLLNRITTPEEVADAVVFFASNLSAAVTGQALDVNCGEWLH
jgi:NAD(P)-dependent dehydrogenase (short-subunit alcohol dehydrogenase family)